MITATVLALLQGFASLATLRNQHQLLPLLRKHPRESLGIDSRLNATPLWMPLFELARKAIAIGCGQHAVTLGLIVLELALVTIPVGLIEPTDALAMTVRELALEPPRAHGSFQHIAAGPAQSSVTGRETPCALPVPGHRPTRHRMWRYQLAAAAGDDPTLPDRSLRARKQPQQRSEQPAAKDDRFFHDFPSPAEIANLTQWPDPY